MSMLNDRDRHLLNDLERQLQEEDAAWMRQFKDPRHHARHTTTCNWGRPWAYWRFWPPSVCCWASPSVR
jgi:hypothetical protein